MVSVAIFQNFNIIAAPDYKEIEQYLRNGPSELSAQDTGEMPPYLDDKWV